MPFILSELRKEDSTAFVDVEAACTPGWTVAEAMEFDAKQQGISRREWVEAWIRGEFEKPNPNSIWLKVVDEESGEFVGCACWRWNPGTAEPQNNAPAEGNASASEPKDDQPRSLMATMGERGAEFKAKFFPTQPHYYLQLILIHPKWQRKGAGEFVVAYGCEKADQAGVIAVLQASNMGLGLYLKHGFEIAQETTFDYRPFGIDRIEPGRGMIRKPRGRA